MLIVTRMFPHATNPSTLMAEVLNPLNPREFAYAKVGENAHGKISRMLLKPVVVTMGLLSKRRLREEEENLVAERVDSGVYSSTEEH